MRIPQRSSLLTFFRYEKLSASRRRQRGPRQVNYMYIQFTFEHFTLLLATCVAVALQAIHSALQVQGGLWWQFSSSTSLATFRCLNQILVTAARLYGWLLGCWVWRGSWTRDRSGLLPKLRYKMCHVPQALTYTYVYIYMCIRRFIRAFVLAM